MKNINTKYIILLIVIAVLAGAFSYFYGYKKSTEVANAEYKMIPELGLKYKLTPENKDVYYTFDKAYKDANHQVFTGITLHSKKSQVYKSITQYTDGQLGYMDQIIHKNTYNRQIGNFIYEQSGSDQAVCENEIDCSDREVLKRIYWSLEPIK